MTSHLRQRIALLAACLLTPLLSDAAVSAAKQAITHETLWMMKRIGTPAVSPDGRWVAVPVLEPAYEQDKEVSDLWLLAVDGSAPARRLTYTRAPEHGVAWSPDSHAIAFATKREGDDVEQIYILDLVGGGEARRLTSVATGAANPRWRPDGKALLFESFVWPNALDDAANKKVIADRKARKYNVRNYEHAPIRFWNEWFDERHPTIMVQSLEEGARPQDILSPTAFARATGFYGTPTNENAITLAPIWSPDGQEIVFTATSERWIAVFAHVGYHLYGLPAAGGAEPRLVTTASGEYRDGAFAPDGRTLFYKYAPQDEEIYHLERLERLPWPAGGEPTQVTRDLDREVAAYAVAPDSRTVYLLVPEAAGENLYRVPAAGGTPERLIAPVVGGYTALVSARKSAQPVLIASYGSSVSPAEIVRIDPQEIGRASCRERV
jgi:Tol biopolymer transport system component